MLVPEGYTTGSLVVPSKDPHQKLRNDPASSKKKGPKSTYLLPALVSAMRIGVSIIPGPFNALVTVVPAAFVTPEAKVKVLNSMICAPPSAALKTMSGVTIARRTVCFTEREFVKVVLV